MRAGRRRRTGGRGAKAGARGRRGRDSERESERARGWAGDRGKDDGGRRAWASGQNKKVGGLCACASGEASVHVGAVSAMHVRVGRARRRDSDRCTNEAKGCRKELMRLVRGSLGAQASPKWDFWPRGPHEAGSKRPIITYNRNGSVRRIGVRKKCCLRGKLNPGIIMELMLRYDDRASSRQLDGPCRCRVEPIDGYTNVTGNGVHEALSHYHALLLYPNAGPTSASPSVLIRCLFRKPPNLYNYSSD